MEQSEFEHWMQTISVPRRKRRAIARELHAHLEDAQRDLVQAGWDEESASHESLRRLGDREEIVRSFNDVYRRPRRMKVGLALALSTGLMVGAFGGGAAAFNGGARTHAVHAQQVHNVFRHRQAAPRR